MKRKRTDDQAEILDGFGEFGPSDPSEDEDDSEGEIKKIIKQGSAPNDKVSKSTVFVLIVAPGAMT